MTILFESPNVFYAVIDGVNIRIDNPEILPNYGTDLGGHALFFSDGGYKHCKHGDIFQVEGFEYELENVICKSASGSVYPTGEKVAILKLAKEEEPKETPNKIVNDTNKSEWNLALESVTHNLKLRGFNEQDYNGKILFDEIEKLKK